VTLAAQVLQKAGLIDYRRAKCKFSIVPASKGFVRVLRHRQKRFDDF